MREMRSEISSESASGNALSDAAQMRRDEIVTAAYEFYREKGLSRTTVKDITEHIGVTRTLFYHYFPNKDALTSAVLDAYVDDFVELLEHWNQNRRIGDVEQALSDVIKVLRMGLFEKDPFHMAMASRENAALYLEFVNRVADHTAKYIIQTTVKDYADLHEVRISHLYETFYVLITGVIGYLRNHPDADDCVIADVIAQTLYMDRPDNR